MQSYDVFLICSAPGDYHLPVGLDTDDGNVVIERISLSSFMKIILDQQAIISSQQEMLVSKDKQMLDLQALLVSQQEMNRIQEEIKTKKSASQIPSVSVVEETIPLTPVPGCEIMELSTEPNTEGGNCW